ncbi:hypothetical protein H9P43_008869 [Blastocladiella emersonii ATCC 22665]|nr:hypothetical protein H9P43_008869 [Blastocladiella emersonii ATCC 22665]
MFSSHEYHDPNYDYERPRGAYAHHPGGAAVHTTTHLVPNPAGTVLKETRDNTPSMWVAYDARERPSAKTVAKRKLAADERRSAHDYGYARGVDLFEASPIDEFAMREPSAMHGRWEKYMGRVTDVVGRITRNPARQVHGEERVAMGEAEVDMSREFLNTRAHMAAVHGTHPTAAAPAVYHEPAVIDSDVIERYPTHLRPAAAGAFGEPEPMLEPHHYHETSAPSRRPTAAGIYPRSTLAPTDPMYEPPYPAATGRGTAEGERHHAGHSGGYYHHHRHREHRHTEEPVAHLHHGHGHGGHAGHQQQRRRGHVDDYERDIARQYA